MSLKSLNELDLSVDLHGCEGLDINYVSRIRSQYLFTQHQTMITQMQFADAKAAALIALIGFITLRGPIKLDEITNLGIFGYVFLGCAGLAVVFTLLSVFPRYPSKANRDILILSDRWSWPALASDTNNPKDKPNTKHSVLWQKYISHKTITYRNRMQELGNFSSSHVI